MKSRNAVDALPVMDIDMSHMNAFLLVDDIDLFIVEIASHPLIQLPDNRHQLRNHLFQIGSRPFFQSLCKDGVVGVRTRLSHHIDGCVDVKASCHQEADQFRNHHGRMGIIDLNDYMLMEMVQIKSALFRLF